MFPGDADVLAWGSHFGDHCFKSHLETIVINGQVIHNCLNPNIHTNDIRGTNWSTLEPSVTWQWVGHDFRDLSPPGKEERALSDDLASNSGSWTCDLHPLEKFVNHPQTPLSLSILLDSAEVGSERLTYQSSPRQFWPPRTSLDLCPWLLNNTVWCLAEQ